jgi:curli biogenesis system outer membrane secretion channel CsgG
MNYRKFIYNFILIAGLSFNLFGCGGKVAPASFIKPEIDLSLIRRVGVLPLKNFSREQMAEKKVRRILISELLATGAFEVVDPGEVNRAVAELGGKGAVGIKIEEIKAMGRRLNVQALIMGAVVEYGYVTSGTAKAPLVSLSLRMVETEKGSIIWSTTVSEGGMGLGTRLLGASRDTISQTAIKAIRKGIYTSLF